MALPNLQHWAARVVPLEEHLRWRWPCALPSRSWTWSPAGPLAGC